MTEAATRAVPVSVISAAAAGDIEAFAYIVRAHHDDMVRVAHLVGGDPDLAQDAAQAAWPIAWRKLDTLRDSTRLRPWLVTIAANEARQLVRRRRRDVVVPIEVADVESVAHDPASRIEDADLLRAFRQLAADDRQILALRYVSGFDATEIARAIGGTPSGIRSRLSRLIARLRQEVGDA